MKTLGMVGGVGPESTIDYYGTIIRLYREKTRDGSYPQFLINSVDMNKGRTLIETNKLPALVDMLAEEFDKLVRGGARFGLIAANTHIWFLMSLRLACLSRSSALLKRHEPPARARGLNKLGLFGTCFTMAGDYYRKLFSRDSIELVSPAPADQDFVRDKYMNELVHGNFREQTHAELLRIVERLNNSAQIDGLILAGTELPLILRETEYQGIPFLNTTLIHCAAAVEEMLT